MNVKPSYGQSVAGYGIGILHINSRYALIPGNVQHAQTFPFPVLYEEVEVRSLDDLFAGAAYIEEELINASKRVLEKGAKVVVGACGSFGYHQKAVAADVPAPVFMSILTQVPLLLQGIGNGALGVICASAGAMNQRMYDQCGIQDPSRLVITEMKGRPTFDDFLAAGNPLNMDDLRHEVLAAANDIVMGHPEVRAILLQCSDLPPFGKDIQRATGLPVFDAALLVHWLQRAADYPSYA